MSLGARQQDIIGNLYKTKSLGLLKLWGRVLARLNQEESLGLVHSAVNTNDIVRAGASMGDVDNIIKEMVLQLTFARLFVFFAEVSPQQTVVFCSTHLPLPLPDLFASFKPQIINSQTVKFSVSVGLSEAERQVLDLLRAEAAKLNLTA